MRWTSRRSTLAVAGGIAAVALAATPAQAQYLDPGAGSVVVQAIIAVVFGASVTLKLYWHRIAAFVRRRSKDGDRP